MSHVTSPETRQYIAKLEHELDELHATRLRELRAIAAAMESSVYSPTHLESLARARAATMRGLSRRAEGQLETIKRLQRRVADQESELTLLIREKLEITRSK